MEFKVGSFYKMNGIQIFYCVNPKIVFKNSDAYQKYIKEYSENSLSLFVNIVKCPKDDPFIYRFVFVDENGKLAWDGYVDEDSAKRAFIEIKVK